MTTILSYLVMMLAGTWGALRYGFAILGGFVIFLGILYIAVTVIHRISHPRSA